MNEMRPAQEVTANLADDAAMIEPAANTSVFFTGIRMRIHNGMTHLMFYCEQPDADGGIEFLVVARMVGTAVGLKASLDSIAAKIQRPTSPYAPDAHPLN